MINKIQDLINNKNYQLAKRMLIGKPGLFLKLPIDEFLPLISWLKAGSTKVTKNERHDRISYNGLWMISMNSDARSASIRLLKSKNKVGFGAYGEIELGIIAEHSEFSRSDFSWRLQRSIRVHYLDIRRKRMTLINLCL